MFDTATLRGLEATIVWGYHTAAVCRRWSVHKTAEGTWWLRADLQRQDGFQLRQRGLRFTAPRPGGYWCWPVQTVTVGVQELRAQLGPPEQ